MEEGGGVMDLAKLKAPFKPAEIEWRVGSTTKDKSKGMALAYIDARAVMDRLDEVCGPDGWQCRYPHANGKTCCELAIKVGDEWVWKSDGAGDTDYEGAKGAFSDAFKRSAVRWGIGRYLYDLESPWVAVEQRGKSYAIVSSEMPRLHRLLENGREANHGELRGPLGLTELKKAVGEFCGDLALCSDTEELDALVESSKAALEQCQRDLPGWWHTKEGSDVKGLADRIAIRREELPDPENRERSPSRLFLEASLLAVGEARTLTALSDWWEKNASHIAAMPADQMKTLLEAKDKRKKELGG